MKREFEYKNESHSKLGIIFKYAGWGIGLVSLLLTIYSEFIRKNEPKLEYDIISSTKFINKNETSANLRIYIDSLDVQENHLNITAFNIKVENKGTSYLRYDDYDQGFFGLKIQNGYLLEPPAFVEVSIDHIKNLYHESDSVVDSTAINIPKLSLDVDDYYILRIVLLHSADSVPYFQPEGRILGQKEIHLNNLKSPTPSFWTLVFIGDWSVHLVRILLYLAIIIISALLVGLTFSKIEKYYKRIKRKHLVSKMSKRGKIAQFVKDDFIRYGEFFIVRIHEVYSKNDEELVSHYQKCKEFVTNKNAKRKNLHYYTYHYNTYLSMIERGYLELKDDNSIAVVKEARNSVCQLYSGLSSNGMLPRHFYHDIYSSEIYDPLTGEEKTE